MKGVGLDKSLYRTDCPFARSRGEFVEYTRWLVVEATGILEGVPCGSTEAAFSQWTRVGVIVTELVIILGLEESLGGLRSLLALLFRQMLVVLLKQLDLRGFS